MASANDEPTYTHKHTAAAISTQHAHTAKPEPSSSCRSPPGCASPLLLHGTLLQPPIAAFASSACNQRAAGAILAPTSRPSAVALVHSRSHNKSPTTNCRRVPCLQILNIVRRVEFPPLLNRHHDMCESVCLCVLLSGPELTSLSALQIEILKVEPFFSAAS